MLVVAPTLADTATGLRLGDASEAAPRAEAIVRATVDALRRIGVRARGHISAADPAVALLDRLRTYDADRVVVARHKDGPLRYREDAPVEAAAAAFGVPLQELNVAAGDPALAAIA